MVEADSCVFDGKKSNDNLIIYIYDSSSLFENMEIGNVISFSPSNFYHTDLFYGEIPNASAYAKNNKYVATVSIGNITYQNSQKTFA